MNKKMRIKNNMLLAAMLMVGASSFQLPLAARTKVNKTVKQERRISRVSPIQIHTAVGTVPQLPWQVWVEYNDGTHEWRQTRWLNSAKSTEQEMADSTKNPVGSHFSVSGFILGDNTTQQGYPIEAQIEVVDQTAVPNAHPVARPLPLSDVQLTGRNRLTNNRTLDVKNLLSINPRQMLYNYRDTYGLPTDGYPKSDGWDSPTTKLKGHGTGHYLSALAFAYATEPEASVPGSHKQQLLDIIRLMVDEMRACQERTFVYDEQLGRYREARDYAPEATLREMKGSWQAMDEEKQKYEYYGYGYLNAIPASHACLIEMYRAYNNEDWVWAPYYTIHKQLAGLIDIAENVDDQAIAQKALLIAKDMGLWVWNRMHYRTFVQSEGTKQERQTRPGNRYEMWNMYIAGEVGGMQESLARLSMMVPDAKERANLLEAAHAFDAPAFFDPVTRNIDDIRTRHANQHIPMIVGALHSFMADSNTKYYSLANNFWNLVQGRYAYAMGGVGNGEMFRQPYSQILSMNTNVMSDGHRQMHPNPDLNETCCSYNLAKLSKDLNMLNPDDARYMDLYERLLSNQLVGSVHPFNYGVTYHYAVGMNARKPFGSETPQSSCCGGTGAENHVKYQEATYFVGDSTIWITQYMPTVAHWREKGTTLTQQCEWPAEQSTIEVKGEARFSMKVRIPYWATSKDVCVKLNGNVIASAIDGTIQPCSYVEIPQRDWHTGDKVQVVLPYTAHLHFGPDKMEMASVEGDMHHSFAPAWVGTLMYGPLVMATSDVKTWDEADFTIQSDLSNIIDTRTLQTTDGSDCAVRGKTDNTGSHLYELQLRQPDRTITLTPDYYQTEHATHYLRLNLLGSETATGKDAEKMNRQMLQVAVTTAHERQTEQSEWMAMTTKVPWHAPWAQHGFDRMAAELARAESLLSKENAPAKEVSEALSLLNASINSMRPGNLAEPEDLANLMPMLTEAKETTNKSSELREAIEYAEMVVQYVNDGSGTHDLIRKATERLKQQTQK